MPILFLTHHAPYDLQWCQTNWTELSCLEVFGGPLMWQREILAEWLSLNADSIPCWTKFRISMQPEFWCSLFIQVQVSDNHEVRKWTFVFSQNQSSDNQAVRNWMFWSGNNCVVHSQVDFSDNHDVTNLEAHFLFMSQFLTNMQSELVLGFCKTHNFRFLGPAAFDCHES